MASKPYVILVGTDYSAHAARAVRLAVREASQRAHSQLHVVHVVPTASFDALPPPGTAQLVGVRPHGHNAVSAAREERLAGALVNLRVPNHVAAHTHTIVGEPASVLIDLASELRAQLLVVGTRSRRSATRWALGSVAEAVVRRATCAVMVIGPRAQLAAELPTKLAWS
jgi:nucleotide-binding universal stress UspA family protein